MNPAASHMQPLKLLLKLPDCAIFRYNNFYILAFRSEVIFNIDVYLMLNHDQEFSLINKYCNYQVPEILYFSANFNWWASYFEYTLCFQIISIFYLIL